MIYMIPHPSVWVMFNISFHFGMEYVCMLFFLLILILFLCIANFENTKHFWLPSIPRVFTSPFVLYLQTQREIYCSSSYAHPSEAETEEIRKFPWREPKFRVRLFSKLIFCLFLFLVFFLWGVFFISFFFCVCVMLWGICIVFLSTVYFLGYVWGFWVPFQDGFSLLFGGFTWFRTQMFAIHRRV